MVSIILIFILFLLKKKQLIFLPFKDKKEFCLIIISGFFITINWFVFIYAIIIQEALQASFGYYIFPMVAVFFGFIFKKEKFSFLQVISIIMSFFAIVILGMALKNIPIISITLAISFGAYGLVKSYVKTPSIISVTLETIFISPIALIIIIYMMSKYDLNSLWFLNNYILYFIMSGILTALPLLLFSYSTKKLNYSFIGFIQFINPTIQFLISIFIFREEFSLLHLFAMIIIWISTFLYCFNYINSPLKSD